MIFYTCLPTEAEPRWSLGPSRNVCVTVRGPEHCSLLMTEKHRLFSPPRTISQFNLFKLSTVEPVAAGTQNGGDDQFNSLFHSVV